MILVKFYHQKLLELSPILLSLTPFVGELHFKISHFVPGVVVVVVVVVIITIIIFYC